MPSSSIDSGAKAVPEVSCALSCEVTWALSAKVPVGRLVTQSQNALQPRRQMPSLLGQRRPTPWSRLCRVSGRGCHQFAATQDEPLTTRFLLSWFEIFQIRSEKMEACKSIDRYFDFAFDTQECCHQTRNVLVGRATKLIPALGASNSDRRRSC